MGVLFYNCAALGAISGTFAGLVENLSRAENPVKSSPLSTALVNETPKSSLSFMESNARVFFYGFRGCIIGITFSTVFKVAKQNQGSDTVALSVASFLSAASGGFMWRKPPLTSLGYGCFFGVFALCWDYLSDGTPISLKEI